MSLKTAMLVIAGFVAVAQTQSQTCPYSDVSSVKVSIRTVQNGTGHMDSKVAFNQMESGASYIWITNVDQNVIDCGEKSKPILETILYIKASPTDLNLLEVQTNLPELPQVEVTTPISEKRIPYGYELFPGVGYYKFHPQSSNWPTARRTCAGEGGHLVIINSEKERDVVKQIFARHRRGDWFHAGILEFGTHAEWFTLFGEPLTSTGFSQIYPGEDNAMGPSDYGCLHRSVEGYGDAPIGALYSFVCEFKI